MAQQRSQNTAQSGGMEKDIDSRLLTATQYRDMLNGNIGRSEGANIGVIENTRGNELLDTNFQQNINGTAIGVVVCEPEKKLYWMSTSDTVNAIYEFDETTQRVSTILIDSRTEMTGGVFNNILNFSEDSLITGINVIDDLLFWTDDRSEPKKINIEKFRNATHSSGTTEIFGREFLERDITVIRPHPTVTASTIITTDGSVPVVNGEVVAPTTSFVFTNLTVTCSVNVAGVITVFSSVGEARLSPSQIQSYTAVAVDTPRSILVTVSGTIPSGFIGSGGNFSLSGICPATQPASGSNAFSFEEAGVTCAVSEDGNVSFSSTIGSTSLATGQAALLPTVDEATDVVVRVQVGGIIPNGFTDAGDLFQFVVNCPATQPPLITTLEPFVFADTGVVCTVNTQTGVVSVRADNPYSASTTQAPFPTVTSSTPRSIQVTVTGAAPPGFSNAGDLFMLTGACLTNQGAQVLGNFTESDWTGGITLSALGEIFENDGNAVNGSTRTVPASLSPNLTSNPIPVLLTIFITVPAGFDNVGSILSFPRTVSQPSNLSNFTEADWTGVITVSQGGRVTSTAGNAGPITLQTTGVPANTNAGPVNAVVSVQVTIPAGFRNFGNTLVLTRNVSQPGTSSLTFSTRVNLTDSVDNGTVNVGFVTLSSNSGVGDASTFSITPDSGFEFGSINSVSITGGDSRASGVITGFADPFFGDDPDRPRQLLGQISGTIGSSNQTVTLLVSGAATAVVPPVADTLSVQVIGDETAVPPDGLDTFQALVTGTVTGSISYNWSISGDMGLTISGPTSGRTVIVRANSNSGDRAVLSVIVTRGGITATDTISLRIAEMV